MEKRGFTLIELLVVMAILVALAGLLFVRYSQAQKKARDTQRINDLHQIATALQSYYQTKGEFPSLTAGSNWIALTGSDQVSTSDFKDFLTVKPDPLNDETNNYQYIFSISLCTGSTDPICGDCPGEDNLCQSCTGGPDLKIPCDLKGEPAVYDKLEVTKIKSIWPNEDSWLVIPLSQPLISS